MLGDEEDTEACETADEGVAVDDTGEGLGSEWEKETRGREGCVSRGCGGSEEMECRMEGHTDPSAILIRVSYVVTGATIRFDPIRTIEGKKRQIFSKTPV